MNYELAEQLRDAGFPKLELWDDNFSEKDKNINTEYDNQYIPTLSELIEACGDLFQVLWKREDGWIAKSWINDEIKENYHEALGSTPEEAVARLWLVINKK